MSTLTITIPSIDMTCHLHSGEQVSIGRKSNDCVDIQLDDQDKLLSRRHLAVSFENNKIIVIDTKSVNGVRYQGKLLKPNKNIEIQDNEKVKIGSFEIFFSINKGTLISAELETLKNTTFNKIKHSDTKEERDFIARIANKEDITIGRSLENDFVINDMSVSRNHAKFYYENGSYWIEDLSSKNGVFLDETLIKNKVKVNIENNIFICLHSFDLRTGYRDMRKEIAIRAEHIKKIYPNGKCGLREMNIEIPYSEFVAVMGPSGCGKSTLLKTLNGYNPASSGKIFIHGLDLIKHYNLLKNKIGYVPQGDIIHEELTLRQTMKFAAKLRLPSDINSREANYKINSILISLFEEKKLDSIYDEKVKSLSGGERKRLSIAVELLNDPSILFLDEPTSPLDPESIHEFLSKVNKLKDNGTTIIMVTHKPEDLTYVDSVIFLGTEGQHVYYGSGERILDYFEKQNIVEVYNLLTDKEVTRFFYNRMYQKSMSRNIKTLKNEISNEQRESLLPQLYWLIARYLQIKLNDKENLALLLAQPIIIAGLISFIFKEFQVGVLFLMAISAIWFGVSNAAKEIVAEQAVYKRERMLNLNLNTYLLSKLFVLSGVAFVQVFIFASIIYLKFSFNTTENFENIYLQDYKGSIIFMFFLSCSATLLGLFLSAIFSNTEKVMTVVPIALMPQIMLAGVITRLDNWLVEIFSFLTFGRWGTEGMARIQDKYVLDQNGNEDPLSSVIYFAPRMKSDTVVLTDNCQCISLIPDMYSNEVMSKGALDILDYYNLHSGTEQSFYETTMNNFIANNLAIGLLNVFIYILIIYFLKKKDSI